MAFDGDADRCLLVDETGGVIDGDKVLAVCGLDMKRQGQLRGNALVATVMSQPGPPRVLPQQGTIDLDLHRRGRPERAGEDAGARTIRIGGEQSGHTIFTDSAPPPATASSRPCSSCRSLPRGGKKASELAWHAAPHYPQVLINVAVPHSGGVKETHHGRRAACGSRPSQREEEALGRAGRILVRPSGTEALIRVMVEAKTDETAHECGADFG